MQIIQMADQSHICIMALSFGAWCHGPSHQSSGDHTPVPYQVTAGWHRLGGVTHPAQVAGLWQPTGLPYLVHLFNCAFDENILSANHKAAVQCIWPCTQDKMLKANLKTGEKKAIQVTLGLSVPDRLVRIEGFMLSHPQDSHRMENRQWATDVEEQSEQTRSSYDGSGYSDCYFY